MNKKIYILFVIYIVVLYLVEFLANMDTKLDFRIRQSSNQEDNKFKKKFITYFDNNTKHMKKYNMESLSLQAGLNMTYGEIAFKRLTVGLVLGGIIGVLLKNPLMGFLFVFLGSLIPSIRLQNIKNKRYQTLNQQIGPMMYMLNKRYENTGDFVYALELTTIEYEGIEPMHTELKTTMSEIAETGMIKASLDNLARRTDNYYLQLLSDYFEIAYEIGSDTSRELLNQAYEQFEEDRKLKELLEQELDQVIKEAYIMIAAVPVFIVFSAVAMPDFIPVITGKLVGKIAITAVTLVVILCLWFVNKFVNAPLE